MRMGPFEIALFVPLGCRAHGSKHVSAGVTPCAVPCASKHAHAVFGPCVCVTLMRRRPSHGAFLEQKKAPAAAALRAATLKRDVIYAPAFWWGIMTVIRAVPERVFKKLNI